MLNDHDSNALYNQCKQSQDIKEAFDIVAGTGAKFGQDGDQYYYGFGELPEPTGVYGFGPTPVAALLAFSSAYWSQKVKE